MARKAKRQTIAQDQQPAKSAEEVFEEHYPVILDAKTFADDQQDAARKANSSYRSKLKSFKNAGGDIDALTAALADRKKEPAEVDRNFRNRNNYLRWMGIPVGTQLGLFADGETVATKVDNDQIAKNSPDTFEEGRVMSSEASIRKAKTEGYEDGAEGKTARNIYDDGSPEALAYSGAYADAQEKIAKSLGRSRNGKSHEHAGATA